MDEEKKKAVALFRFGVISDFVNGARLARGEKERLLRARCAQKWSIPHCQRTRLARSTILRWVKKYQDGGGKLEALYPQERSDRGLGRSMSEDTALALLKLKEKMPEASVPLLIEKMKTKGLLPAGEKLPQTSVYRLLHRHALMTPLAAKKDRRKFEAEFPNDLWQSDAMHGPMIKTEQKRKKSYLFAFIDDHSRLVPHGEFYLSENIDAYLLALFEAVSKRGLPRKLYIDNGPAFRSKHLEYTVSSLGVALIHSKPYKPQGRGKIERFFRTVRQQFLTGFRGKTLFDLNMSFDLWLNDIYHQRKHSATGETPFARFTAHMECIRCAPKDLADYFRKAETRKVAKDRTITLNGKLYEAPVALIGKRVTVLYHKKDQSKVEVKWENKSYGLLKPVNLNVNCRVRRDRNSNTDMSIEQRDYTGGKLLLVNRKEAS